jgi:hypothetical protein
MTGYWIKLYHELLDDPKMATMPDHLWRRTIELFLVAGKINHAGNIPNTKEIAWYLRTDEKALLADLEAIAALGIISKTENGWVVNKFSIRQAAVSDRDRKANQRERDKKAQYYGHEDVTESRRKSNQECDENDHAVSHGDVTKCDTDTDTETDTETDKDKDPEHIIPAQKQKQEQDRPIELIDQQYIPLFRQIAGVFKEEDLPPTSKRINTLKKAMKLTHIGGFDRILEAASNLACSLSPHGMKRYDWLLHGFDFEEHITEFLTRKNNGKPKPRKYASVPDDWRPEDAINTTAK